MKAIIIILAVVAVILGFACVCMSKRCRRYIDRYLNESRRRSDEFKRRVELGYRVNELEAALSECDARLAAATDRGPDGVIDHADSLRAAAAPLVDFITAHYHMNCVAVVQVDRVEIYEAQEGTPLIVKD